MMCHPRAADTDRTVIETTAVDTSNDWWTGLVRDRDPETGERRLRLERWVKNDNDYDNPHTWRVRPDFWTAEREAVTAFFRHGGGSPPSDLPLDPHLTALEYREVRRDDTRWVAIVRVDRPYKGECVRLYHWGSPDHATRQRWTVGRHWDTLEATATERLQAGR